MGRRGINSLRESDGKSKVAVFGGENNMEETEKTGERIVFTEIKKTAKEIAATMPVLNAKLNAFPNGIISFISFIT